MTTSALPASSSAPARRPRPLSAMLASETRLLARDPATVIWSVILPLVASIVLAVVPGTSRPVDTLGGFSFSEIYTPVLILFAATILAVQVLPSILSQYRADGVLRRLRATPARPAQLLGALTIIVAVVMLVTGVVLTVVPGLLGAGWPDNPVAFALVGVLTGASCLSLGLLLAAVIRNPKLVPGVGAAIAAVLWFFAGMWVPRTVFPDWLDTLASGVNTGVASEGMLMAVQGQWPAWPNYVVLVVWIVVPALVAVRAFRWE